MARIVGREFAGDETIGASSRAPRVDVRHLEMGLERRHIQPHLGKADKAGIERILGDVVGDAASVLARGFNARAQVRQRAGDAVGREAERPEDNNGDGGRLVDSQASVSGAAIALTLGARLLL